MTGPIFYTVPFDPELAGEELKGSALRAIRLAARMVTAAGYTAEQLRARKRWNEPTVAAAAVRVAVGWGLVP